MAIVTGIMFSIIDVIITVITIIIGITTYVSGNEDFHHAQTNKNVQLYMSTAAS